MTTTFNPLTKVYKVTKEDGTFDTYTPLQYEEKFDKLPEVVEDIGDETPIAAPEESVEEPSEENETDLQESADKTDEVKEEAEVATAPVESSINPEIQAGQQAPVEQTPTTETPVSTNTQA